MTTQELEQLRSDVARKQHLEASLARLKRQKSELAANVRACEEVSSSEDADVAKLEKVSLTSLFYKLTGSLEHKLDLERIEAYAARVKLDTAKQSLAAMEAQLAKTEAELCDLQGCEERYRSAVTEQIAKVRAADPETAEKIAGLEQQIAAADKELAEIREAVEAGSKARETLRKLQSELDDAEGYAAWDVMGGGLIADIGKHSHLDSAQWLLHTLQGQLHTLGRELKDVSVTARIEVEMDGFMRFADYFIDNLWTDWAAMDHIGRAQGQVNQTASKLGGVMSKLNSMCSAAEKKKEDLRAAIEDVAITG